MKSASYLALLVAVAGCSPESTPAAADHGPAQFIGSTACADCHETEYRDWRGSHHELAMQVATTSTVLGDFANTELDYFGHKTLFSTHDGEYFVRTRNATGDEQEFQIAYTFGVTPLQQYLVKFPGGRMQALPYTWDSRPAEAGGQRWYHLYPDEYIGPGDELHWTGRMQNWNYMCAECHSTNLVMGYDAASKTFDTTYSELSVGCEACHGPASQHRDQAVAGNFATDFGLPVDLDDNKTVAWVMNPETGIAERSMPVTELSQQPEACGRCHSRRGVIATDYKYGKPLADTHRVALLEENLYFDDGQIKEEVYVYGSFVQSRMHREGVTCSDCHNPHSGRLHNGAEPSGICSQCHLPATFATTEHSRHESDDASCVDCHMTSRTYMGIDDRRDHSFRVPRPDLGAGTNAPNACVGCHTDRTNDWATAAITEWTGPDVQLRPHIGTIIAASHSTPANDALASASMNTDFPAIGRATALTRLELPLGNAASNAINSGLNDPNPLLRIAALRVLRLTSADTRLRMGSKALDDPILGVRLEAVPAYIDIRDLLPAADARAFGRAAEEYRAANLMLASTPEALANLAGFALSSGNVELETEYLRDALQLQPDNAHLRHTMGLALVRSGESEEGLVQLRHAHEQEPLNPRYVYVYGVALNSLGLNDEALALLRNAYRQFPEDFDIGWAVATMLRDSGDSEDARMVVQELASRFPDNANIGALQESLR